MPWFIKALKHMLDFKCLTAAKTNCILSLWWLKVIKKSLAFQNKYFNMLIASKPNTTASSAMGVGLHAWLEGEHESAWDFPACGQLTVTQGSEIPAGSDCMLAYLPVKPWVHHTFTWEWSTKGTERDNCAGHKHSKSAATHGCATKDWAKHASVSGAVMPRLQRLPEYIFEDFSIP